MALILDTGPLYAAMDSRDHDHAACAELLTTTRELLVVPGPVLVEVDWLCGSRLGRGAFATLLADVDAGAIEVTDLAPSDYRRVFELVETYADLALGFVDAAVVAIVERFREPKVATLDRRHFAAVRPSHVDALMLLPE